MFHFWISGNMKNSLSIGSDPEFIIIDNRKKPINALCFFSGNYESCINKNCEPRDDDEDYCEPDLECDGNDFYSSEIGCDGECMLGELRPRYADSPIKHHDNIRKLIKQIEVPNGYKVLAGTVQKGHSLGGHIHLGISKRPIDDSKWYIDMKDAANYISYYAGIPLKMIEYKRDLAHRGLNSSIYGNFGAHYVEEYGLQWRMPASWIVSSEIALATLCLTYTVAYEYTINPEKIDMDFATYAMMVRAKNADNMIEKVDGMQKYSLYSKKIDPIFQLIADGKKWKKNENILDMW